MAGAWHATGEFIYEYLYIYIYIYPFIDISIDFVTPNPRPRRYLRGWLARGAWQRIIYEYLCIYLCAFCISLSIYRYLDISIDVRTLNSQEISTREDGAWGVAEDCGKATAHCDRRKGASWVRVYISIYVSISISIYVYRVKPG